MAPPIHILQPTDETSRIASLDILRGVAVLGILIMNIQSFSMPASAYLNPTSFQRLTNADLYVWLISHVLADQKFMAIFSILFGASIIMISSKAQKEHLRSSSLQYKRFIYLGLIGLIHAYLLWAGDILFPYAICGLLMFAFRNYRSSLLVKIAFVILFTGSAISLLFGYSISFWEPGEIETLDGDLWKPSAQAIAQEIEYYTSNWEKQMQIRVPQAFGMQTQTFLFDSFWRISGCILIGMALYKRRVFKLKQPNTYYIKMIVFGLGIGLPLVLMGTLLDFNYDWDFHLSFFYFSQFNYWGSLFMAMGYIGVVMLLCKSTTRTYLARTLAHVGRMALSNYLLQTIICTSICYGHGMGLFGELDRLAQGMTVLVVWVIIIIFSNIWLKYFKYGPFEWIWRTLTYGKVQPLIR